ncbi:MAG: Foldase protein PrsA [Candidatus Moranbacteria bacterium GW2011_GWE1_35_17]|nr:MAG: Foldase protein PrsA [Candidatus Moranbacteria bacterium GW2011_GWE1_35_17]KKP70809.1 MAG: Foldase protein PrsA [Candidatus Moranbacteria bacterium GW2011_GWE2_35_164]KKP82999.1 MAG: Foldase protein PrsA [Candidatus Moranbacteria bacterium GW2011_GWF2_35_54]KKP84446.1 MAG: Foldase protein PrsA [Candidatus Moranbacteria bacterium GW2011_GWF1_35_5]
MGTNRKSKKETTEKIKITTLVYGVAIFVVALFLIGAVFIYRFNSSRSVPNYIYNRVFLPAVIIDGFNFISIGSINQNLISIRKFYESQDFSSLGLRFDFNTDDGKKRLKIREKELMNKMIEDRAIEILARERGANVTKKTVADNVSRKMDEYGNTNSIKENLHNLYGWTVNDFENKIVRPSLYKDALEQWMAENDGKDQNEKSKNNAQSALEKIKTGGDFEKIAKDISEGGTADTGGKLGWFKEDQISLELKDKVIALEKGDFSDVLESKLGYHLIRLNDTKEVEGIKVYEISQIFFPKASFASWLDRKIKEMKVVVLLEEYEWNEEEGLIRFKDKKMEEFEEESLNKAEKDASLLTL